MAAKEVRARFMEGISRTKTVESFRFIPDEKMVFEPGQFLQVIFDEKDRNNKDLNKYLSFSSSPGREYVEVTKRMSSSAFSARLGALKPGDKVLLKAPLGNCVFRPEYGKIGFLIGGIGITPVISIIEHIADKKLDNSVVLFYSNRTEAEIAFKKELDAWRNSDCNIKVIYMVTDCQPADNSCEFGHIDKGTVSANMPDMKERIMFITGPPGMVESLKNVCLDLGCSPDRVKTENFVGY